MSRRARHPKRFKTDVRLMNMNMNLIRTIFAVTLTMSVFGCMNIPKTEHHKDTIKLFECAYRLYLPRMDDKSKEIRRVIGEDNRQYLLATHRERIGYRDSQGFSFLSAWDNPPEEVINTLLNEGHRVAGVSTLSNRNDIAENQWVMWVTILDWVSDVEVVVNIGVYHGPLAAGGMNITLRKEGGQWIIDLKTMSKIWVS